MSSFPLGSTILLCLAKVSEASIICFLMPFVNQMVASFNPSSGAVARYSGVIESALIITEAVCSPLWGVVADRVGRKYLLVFGLAAFAIASVALGLSKTLLQAVLARCISGVLGAVAVLVRTIQFEIADVDSVDRVLEWLAPTWAIGASIGPLIGGALAEPAKTMPGLFKGTIFDEYPYLLPSIVVSILPTVASVSALVWLPETLGKNPSEQAGDRDISEDTPLMVSSSLSSLETLVELEPVPTYGELIRDPRLMYPLFCSAALSFVSMAYNAGFMMMASAPLENGGLDLLPWQIGVMLAVSSVLGVLVGSVGTAYLNRRYGWYKALRIAFFFHVLLFPLIAFTSLVAGLEQGVGPFTTASILCVLVCYEIGELSFSGVDVAVGDRSPKGCLASITGLSSCCSSLGRVLAPLLAGQLWSFASETTLPGGRYSIWIIFTFTAVFWHCLTLRLDEPCKFAPTVKGWKDEEAETGSIESVSTTYGTFARRSVIDTLLDGYESSGLDTDSDDDQREAE